MWGEWGQPPPTHLPSVVKQQSQAKIKRVSATCTHRRGDPCGPLPLLPKRAAANSSNAAEPEAKVQSAPGAPTLGVKLVELHLLGEFKPLQHRVHVVGLAPPGTRGARACVCVCVCVPAHPSCTEEPLLWPHTSHPAHPTTHSLPTPTHSSCARNIFLALRMSCLRARRKRRRT